MEIAASILGDPGIQDMMMAAFDHMDRVDLDIAKMFDRRPRCLRSGSEGSTLIEPLRPQPESPRLGFRNRNRRSLKHEARNTEHVS